ncbi:MAG: adenylyltransferase/cytidyltransferase family protein, partial [Thermoplasmata archaeon]|nr:adenylyltransferase/cytidyltransferase family protein [Thermoplasmata archaeon]
MARVAVGGTFEIIHIGHRALLAKAFAVAVGDEVLIGLTSDHLAKSTRGRMV